MKLEIVDSKLKTLKWGIIGCGDVTEVKSGPAFQKTENSELVAVMRRNAEKAADYAKRHQVPTWYSDADQLINDPKVNAIYIATPPSTHAEYAIRAMKAGKPVYVEKPMAASYAECRQMIQVSQETGMPLHVAYYRRTLPAYLKVKELIANGTLGDVLSVSIKLHLAHKESTNEPGSVPNWRVDPSIAGAGLFFDLASHQLDYLDFLFGPISEQYGIAANQKGFYPAEDTVSASFKFENGVVGTGNWCFVVDPSVEKDEIEIVGTKGRVALPCFSPGSLELTTARGNEKFDFENPVNISHLLVKNVVESLLAGTSSVSTGESAARTNRVLEAIVKNYYQKAEE